VISLSGTGLDALAHRIQQEVDTGNITAAQLAIGLDGEVAHFQSFGTATTTDRFIIFSATKALVAMALLPHFADGTLDLTTPVAHYVPEFGHHGKDDVTVLHLLTMQGGFPQAPIGPDRCHPAGSRTEYHPVSAHWVIAELLESLNGRGYLDVVHERVMQPAGVGRILGPQAVGAVTVRTLGEYPTDLAGLAATFGNAEHVPVASIAPEALLSMNDPRAQAAGLPGGGVIATAADIATIYQHFLHNFGGALPDEWLADAVGTIRNGSVSVTDKVPANRTIAGYLSGNDGYHLHRWMPAAPRAFGHNGAGGQLCWVDPASGLSCGFLHDTLHQDPRVEFKRAADLNDLVLALLR